MKQLKPACANTAPQMELQNCLHLKKNLADYKHG